MSLVGTLWARSNRSGLVGLFKCLGAEIPGQKRVALGKGLLLALVSDLNEIALTLLEKNLDAVVHESIEKTKETGLKTAELSNGGKSDWFNLKDTYLVEKGILTNICIFCSCYNWFW